MFFSVLWVEILNGRHRGTRPHTGWLSYNSYPTPPTIEKIVVGVGVWLKNLEDIKFVVVVWNICLIKGGAINFSLSFQNVKLIFIVWKMIIDWDFSFHYDLFHVLLLLLYFNLWSLRFYKLHWWKNKSSLIKTKAKINFKELRRILGTNKGKES